MIARLTAASGSTKVVMLTLSQDEASVSVLKDDGQVGTWAYREGTIAQVPTDLTFVNQLAFDPARFNLDDLGSLFTQAAAVSGSSRHQELQIVDRQQLDHEPADIKMSVSTDPETRTVFFNADGSLVPTLDFATTAGIRAGLKDVIGARQHVSALGVGLDTGAWAEFPSPTSASTIVRRQRTAKFPVTDAARSASGEPIVFAPASLRIETIEKVLAQASAQGLYRPGTSWSVRADGTAATVRLTFTVGGRTWTTDLDGNAVTG